MYVEIDVLQSIKQKIEDTGFSVTGYELVLKPVTKIMLEKEAEVERLENLLDKLSDHDDVQKVFTTYES